MGISTRTPTTSICRTTAPSSRAVGTPSLAGHSLCQRTPAIDSRPSAAHPLHRPPGGPEQRAGGAAGGAMTPPASPASSRPDSTSAACSHRLSVAICQASCGRRRSRARTALPQLGGHELFGEGNVTLRGGLDAAQVAGRDAEVGQRRAGPGHLQRVGAVMPAGPADQAVVLQLGQAVARRSRPRRAARPGSWPWRWIEAAGRPRPRPRRRRARWPASAGYAAVTVQGVQALLDHPQRQVLVPLRGQDVAGAAPRRPAANWR